MMVLLVMLIGTAAARCGDAPVPHHDDWGTSDGEAPQRRMPAVGREHYLPGAAAAWAIIPGGGQIKVCDRAAGWTTTSATVGGAVLGAAVIGVDNAEPLAFPAFSLAQNTWFYGVYDSYRVSSMLRGGRPDRQPVDGAKTMDHIVAPFKAKNLSDPIILGAAGIGIGMGVASSVWGGAPTAPIWRQDSLGWSGNQVSVPSGLVLGEAWSTAMFLPVGPGEEGLFRGVIQPALVDMLGPGGGIAISSVIFGSAHYLNGGGDPALGMTAVAITGSLGAGLGVLAHHDRYALSRPIAAHFWYDLMVMSTVFMLRPQEVPWAFSFDQPI